MTSYMLFAAAGMLIYMSVAVGEAAIARFANTQIAVAACASPCGHGRAVIDGDERLTSRHQSQPAEVSGDSQAVAAGKRLFQQRGCANCHRTEASGVGPRLDGLFGSPIQDPSCGTSIVDESYLREAILNPSATVAVGFAPVMPTFAGLLSEEELRSLVEYLKSLDDEP